MSPPDCHDDPTTQHGAWFRSGRQVFKPGIEGIVSKRLRSRYSSGRTTDWLKMKNPAAPAVKREAEEEWGKDRWRWERKRLAVREARAVGLERIGPFGAFKNTGAP